MNPLPRVLGLALFLILAILTALLATPIWRNRPNAPASASVPAATAASDSANPPASAKAASMAQLSQRIELGLAVIASGLAIALIFSLAFRPGGNGTAPPFATARHEIDTLAKLAESSVAQGAELSRERDVRRRAEEDAQLKQQLLAQSVDEKIRLGRDLHDGIIQSLYAVGLTLESLRPLLQNDPAQAERRLDEIRTSLNAAIRDVRSYITGLAPENLRRASFSRAVAGLFEQLRAGRSVDLDIVVDDEAAARLSVQQNVEALQIAREAISNALRHGEASHITLRMHQGDGEVCLLVQDNGRGFAADSAPGGGHGLANMRARAEALGATLKVTSRPGEGARVIATFPQTESTAA